MRAKPRPLRIALPLALLAFPVAFSALAQTAAPQGPPKTPPGCGPRVIVEYTDDDPDYFIVKNRSAQGWNLAMLAVDLGPSAGSLIFDTDHTGPGAGGPAPFEPNSHSVVRLAGAVRPRDGGRTVALHFEDFAPGLDYSFSVDLDALDSGERRTWVLPADIDGARVLAGFRGPDGTEDKVDAVFDGQAEADSGAGGCV